MSVYARVSLPVTVLLPGSLPPSRPDARIDLGRIVGADRVAAYLWIVGGDRDGVIGALRDDESVASVETLDEVADRTLVRLTGAPGVPPLLDVVGETGVGLVGATGTDAGWLVDVRAPDGDALATFYEACRTRDIAVEVRGLNEPGFASGDADYGLSAVQRETLARALDAGYFEVPRRTTLAELAAGMDVSEQAASERLRRGLSRLLAATVVDPGSE